MRTTNGVYRHTVPFVRPPPYLSCERNTERNANDSNDSPYERFVPPERFRVPVNFTAFRFMDDADLAERVLKLERKCEELRQANTVIALRMLEEYGEALQAAKQELARRQT